MGLFSSSQPEPQHPPQETVIKKSARKLCWDARDKLFACLDKNNIIDAIKNDSEVKAKCGPEDAEYNKDCISSWVCTN